MATIYNETPYSVLSGTAYSDTITNTGHHVTIYAGAGDDSIHNTNRGGALSLAGAYAYIDAGDGNDNIIHYDWAAYGTVLGGAGDDTIMSRAAESTISGGTGNDSIRNVTGLVSMHGGAGNDIIVDVGFIDGINHGNTIAGGQGDDTISLSSAGYENVIQYSYGDGSDIVYNLTAKDTVIIDGGSGTYSTQKSGANVLVNVGSGKISLIGAANLSTVNISGKEVFANSTASVATYGTTGDDNISISSGSYQTVYAYAGNDTIYNGNSNYAKIFAGLGNDTIKNYGLYQTIECSTGDDSIYSFSFHDSISGGAGDDRISVGATNGDNTINPGLGNDLISLGGTGNIIQYSEGDGYDSIIGIHSNDTISISGSTSYTRSTVSGNVVLNFTNGAMTLDGDSDFKIVGGNTINIINSSVDGTKLYALLGEDSIKNYGDEVTIVGATDADSIWNYGATVSVEADRGDDFVENRGSSVTLNGSDGADTLRNAKGTANQVNLSGGAGDDDLKNWGNKVTMFGGVGNDSLYNYQNDGGGANVYMYCGDGDDRVSNWGTNVTILGGAGEDSIINNGTDGGSKNVSIDGGAGNDIIRNFGTDDTLLGGAGNDSIINNKLGYVNGEAVVEDGGKNCTIIGGAGDDSLVNNDSANVLFKYATGEGNDIIVGFNETSTLSIDEGKGNYSKKTSGGDVIVTVGDNKITLEGAASLSKLNILGKEKTTDTWKLSGTTATYGSLTVKGVISLDGLSLNGKTVTVSKASLGTNKVTISDGYSLALGDDVNDSSTKKSWTLKSTTATYKQTTTAGYFLEDNEITYTKKATKTLATVKGVTSTDGLEVSGKTVTVSKASLGTNKVTISDGYTLALGDDVNDSSTKKSWTLKSTTATYKQTTTAGYSLEDNAITYTKKATKTLATVKGVTSTDGLKVSGKTVTVSKASLGTNKVTISDGYTLALGDDVNDSYTKKSWTLKSTTATYKQTTTAGYSLEDNAITYSKKSSKTLATVKGVNDKSGLKVSGKTIKLAGSSLASKVTVSGAYTFDFASDYSKATITGSNSNDTIIARGKKVLVKGGKGSDTIQILGTGTISGYEEGDKISLSSAADIATKGEDVIFNGKVTVTGAADKSVTYIEGGVEKIYSNTTNDAVEFNAKGTSATLLVTYRADIFDAADYPDYADTLITIKASAVKHSLEINGNKNANKITGTSEDDVIDGKAGGDTLGGGKGDDKLYGGIGSDSLNGGAGNDSLWGGVGSDTLVGGVGEDVFIYQDGDGKDVISDYAPGIDTVMILSGKIGTPLADTSGDVTFKVGSKGQITFTDSTKKSIELVDRDGNTLGRYIPS